MKKITILAVPGLTTSFFGKAMKAFFSKASIEEIDILEFYNRMNKNFMKPGAVSDIDWKKIDGATAVIVFVPKSMNPQKGHGSDEELFEREMEFTTFPNSVAGVARSNGHNPKIIFVIEDEKSTNDLKNQMPYFRIEIATDFDELVELLIKKE